MEVEKPKKLAPVVDLMSALKQSLAEMEGTRKSRRPQPNPEHARRCWQITPRRQELTSGVWVHRAFFASAPYNLVTYTDH